MTTCDVGDIVLVSFPFTNLQATKKRPAVVISNTAYQQARPDVIVMPSPVR
jgi:mRNA interferase MazF